MSRPRQYRRIYDPAPQNAPQVQLELSAKLAPTILVIDDENGMKRQYRLTNKSRDGRKVKKDLPTFFKSKLKKRFFLNNWIF